MELKDGRVQGHHQASPAETVQRMLDRQPEEQL